MVQTVSTCIILLDTRDEQTSHSPHSTGHVQGCRICKFYHHARNNSVYPYVAYEAPKSDKTEGLIALEVRSFLVCKLGSLNHYPLGSGMTCAGSAGERHTGSGATFYRCHG